MLLVDKNYSLNFDLLTYLRLRICCEVWHKELYLHHLWDLFMPVTRILRHLF